MRDGRLSRRPYRPKKNPAFRMMTNELTGFRSSDTIGLVNFVPALFRDLAVGGFLYLLPGWALLRVFGPAAGLSWKMKAGLAPALSLPVYPLLYLAAKLVHAPVTLPLAVLPGLAGAVSLLWMNRTLLSGKNGGRPKILSAFKTRPALDSVFFLVLLAVIFAARMIAVRGMETPSWGDSVHHTMIVRLLVENQGLFSSWAPYAPMLTFSYHFGFHSAAAAWAWTAGVPAIQAVLSAGQILNVLACLVLYPVGVKLGRSVWAGLGAVATAGLFSAMPGFSVNWGRYTQLTSLVMLPVLIWFLDSLWRDRPRPKAGMIGLLALVLAGIFLSHYRVVIIALSAAAVWSLRALGEYRKTMAEWPARAWRLAAAGIGALVLISSWIPMILSGGTPQRIQASLRPDAVPRITDLGIWTRLGFYIGPVFWVIGVIALGLAVFRNRKLAADLALWIGLSFVAANPYLFRLPGTGIESNFVLIVMLYIPIAWLAGSALGEAAAGLNRNFAGRVALAAVFAVSLIFGFSRQAAMVDPFHRMVEKNDVAAFRWIRAHTPKKARFLTNATLAFNDSAAVGTDAGWWMPYFTRRWIPFLPLQFSAEKLPPGVDPRSSRRLVLDIRGTQGDFDELARIFLRENLDYVYLGEKRGTAAYDAVELLPESWLRRNPYFIEEARFGAALIWRFDAKAAASIPFRVP